MGNTMNSMHEVFKTFVPELFQAPEMVDYLQENVNLLDAWRMTNSIGKAPIPLKRKLEMLQKMVPFEDLDAEMKERNCEYKDVYPGYIIEMVESLTLALYELKSNTGAILLLTEWNGAKKSGSMEAAMPFLNYQKVCQYLQSDEVGFEDTNIWHSLEIWKSDEAGNLKCDLEFYLLKGEPVSFWADWYSNINDSGFEMNGDLSLPVPFQPGDLLEVGIEPFCPKQRVLVTDIGDNWDCCCLQVAYCVSHRPVLRS